MLSTYYALGVRDLVSCVIFSYMRLLALDNTSSSCGQEILE